MGTVSLRELATENRECTRRFESTANNWNRLTSRVPSGEGAWPRPRGYGDLISMKSEQRFGDGSLVTEWGPCSVCRAGRDRHPIWSLMGMSCRGSYPDNVRRFLRDKVKEKGVGF